MMKAKYRFHCRSWGYECISDIGAERGPHYSKVAMVCNYLKEVDAFEMLNLGAMVDSIPGNQETPKPPSSSFFICGYY